MVRRTDRILEEEVFFYLFSGATDGQDFGRRIFFLIYLVVRRTDRVLGEEVFFCIYLAVRPTDRVLEEEVFLNLFSGATDRHGFGRRNFFFEFI